jgi:putative NADH-flavin reductase
MSVGYTPMRVLVLGATGSVGRSVVGEALRRRHDVTALVRSPQKLGELAARVSIVRGDALESNTVSQAVAGQAAVIYVLGAGNIRHTTLFSDSTRILLAAMERQSVRRLIAVTGVGAGETKGHGGFVYDRILYPLFTKGIYADKDKQEALIQESQTEWTIVRPAPFKKRTPPGRLQAATNVGTITLRRISRPEVATFLVDELEQNRYVRQAVFIGHE